MGSLMQIGQLRWEPVMVDIWYSSYRIELI
jgi:hypothetical protein